MDDQLRRRSVGAPAARSVLLTLLGEYLAQRDDEVWHETLVAALETMGYRTQAARQALARSITAGWLRTERRGRRSRVRLSEETAAMLRAGATRIFGFGTPWEWDGRWLLVALRVPEERRDIRHQARTRLAWQGFGSLGGGLWISPHVERESELPGMVDDSVAELTTFRAEIGALGDPARVIAQAWDLDVLADAYAAFVARFSRLRPTRPEAVFRAQTELVHAWRKFPFLDPDIPEGLLPARWPRSRAHELFQERHALWNARAQDCFRALEAANDGNVVERGPALARGA